MRNGPAIRNPPIHYGAFYWPLVIVGFFTVLSELFRSGVLARTPGAERELAAFAIASSIVGVLQSTLILAPQLPNVFSRSPAGNRVCRGFLLWLCGLLTLPIIFLGFFPAGKALIGMFYEVDSSTLEDIVLYLRLTAPVILLTGTLCYWTGLLMQCNRTAFITILNIAQFASVVFTLFIGELTGLRPVVYASLSQTIPMAMAALLGFGIVCWKYRAPELQQHHQLSYGEVFAFFWPAALSTLLFVLNRPLIFSFLSSTAGAIAAVAALRVALDVCMVFFHSMNQFRNVYVSFGERDLAGVRKFLLQVSVLMVATMAFLVFTPMNEVIFGGWLGLRNPVKSMAIQAFSILCLIPLVIALRSEFHGRALLARSTRLMGVASLISLMAVVLACWILSAINALNHATAAAVLVFGFVTEVAVIAIFGRKSMAGFVRHRMSPDCGR